MEEVESMGNAEKGDVTDRRDEKRGDPLDTPVMRQYREIKREHPDCVLFFRMGDFYELFLEDAVETAPLMDVALTARQGGVPMAGVPYHSAEIYLSRLLSAGRRVAVAEQEPDPENPKLMRRRVRRILSPGTLVEESLLKSAGHNYLMSVVPGKEQIGVALADVSTGDFFTLAIPVSPDESLPGMSSEGLPGSARLRDFFFRYSPNEILVPVSDLNPLRRVFSDAEGRLVAMEEWKASPIEGIRRIEQACGSGWKGLGYENERSPALGAASLIFHYVARSFPGEKMQLDPPVFRTMGGRRMLLDEQTIRNLDLIQNQQEGGVERTLYRVLDFCKTSAGRRLLKEEILMPLLHLHEIERRQNIVAFFVANDQAREDLQRDLERTSDLERILKRIGTGRGNPRDLGSLRDTVLAVREIFDTLRSSRMSELDESILPEIDGAAIRFARDLEQSLEGELSVQIGSAPFLRRGVDPNLDKARSAAEEGARWILEFEREERERTGIGNLKVKYNRVVGYFIEVSRVQAGGVPADYRRKQTLVGNERFTCDRLEELERTIQGADETVLRRERDAFERFCAGAIELQAPLKAMMRGVAYLDFLISHAFCAKRYGWVRPRIVEGALTQIDAGRHPVVERYLSPGEAFIPNSVRLDPEQRFAILTGPNMAGKSTYIRMIALIQLLSQIGSFVPAKSARLSLVDSIFTRIGAGDNLTRGESTFYVEMLETARILNQCTANSLVIMDEVGRGTSTYDGLSIAWAVVEFLSDPAGPRPRALFATHYHELTVLDEREGVFNLTMDVREVEGRVVFLRKVREGSADRSYGIHVARLAGLPPAVLHRAEEKLRELESGEPGFPTGSIGIEARMGMGGYQGGGLYGANGTPGQPRERHRPKGRGVSSLPGQGDLFGKL